VDAVRTGSLVLAKLLDHPSDRPSSSGLGAGGARTRRLCLPETVRAEALRTVAPWRSRASDPLADPRLVEVAEAVARAGDSLYAAAATGT
jgi:hypothetical protein